MKHDAQRYCDFLELRLKWKILIHCIYSLKTIALNSKFWLTAKSLTSVDGNDIVYTVFKGRNNFGWANECNSYMKMFGYYVL